MPAAAVIPAPIAYIKVVVVKKLVVGSRRPGAGLNAFMTGPLWPYELPEVGGCSSPSVRRRWQVYFEKIRVLKASSTA